MDSDDDYDEFGNFIGVENKLNDSAVHGEEISGVDKNGMEDAVMRDDEISHHDTETAVIAHVEESSAQYETIVVDPLQEIDEEPIIKSASEQKLYIEYTSAKEELDLPEVTYSREYMGSLLLEIPERVRNVAFVGNLHTGKTSLIDKLVLETHPGISEFKRNSQDFKSVRFLDTHKLEKERGLSINPSLLSLLLADSKDRSYAFNIIDCPGHPDFQDDVLSSLQVVEGAVLVLDLLEGFTKRDKKIVTQIIKRNIPFTVILNKFDRLILELRIPPRDFYLKVKYTLDEINLFIYHNEFIGSYSQEKLISPLKHNVLFSSMVLKSTFSIRTFAQLYMEKETFAGTIDEERLEKLLWGDISYHEDLKKFTRLKPEEALESKRTFESFILEPIYKLVTYSLTSKSDGQELSRLLWDNFNTSLHKSAYKQDPQTLLRLVFGAIFKSSQYLVDLITRTIPGTGDQKENYAKKLLDLRDSDLGLLVAEAFKVQLTPNRKDFLALVRIHNGSIGQGQRVRIVGDHHSNSNNDESIVEIGQLFLGGGRYRVPIEEASAGNIVIVTGIGKSIEKCATIFDASFTKSLVKPIHYRQTERRAIFKIAVEPEKPRELPKLVEGLRTLSKTYLSAIVKLEESGEHVVLGPGELYMDCFLRDLRYLFDEYLAIKVSDPMVKFSETCGERSVTKIDTYTASKQSRLSITAEPLNDRKLSAAIEKGTINLSQPSKMTSKILRSEFGWDSLAARSFWCFGPDDHQNASILLDDTIEGDTDKEALNFVRNSISTGFLSGISEGPLCGEPIRNCKFKILDAVISGSKIYSGSSQIIPMTRNAIHTGLMTASPKLMEPVYRVTVTCTYKSIDAVQTILGKRRGWVVSESPIPATKLYELDGYVPVIDSVGLDTDMRLQTQGQAMCLLELARWDVVPGDPLDKDCPLPQMKPVPRRSMSRDFVLKTRARKGLSGEPNLQKYLDPQLYSRLRDTGIIN